MIKKYCTLFFAAALALSPLCGCAPESEPVEQQQYAADFVIGSAYGEYKDLFDFIKPGYDAQGYNLVYVSDFQDADQPNLKLQNNELDASLVADLGELSAFNAKSGTSLSSAGIIAYRPVLLYSVKGAALDALADGAIVVLPENAETEKRALLLLQACGLIALSNSDPLSVDVSMISENPKNLSFIKLAANEEYHDILTNNRATADFDLVFLFAAEAETLKMPDANLIAVEAADSESARVYGSVIATKPGNEVAPAAMALIQALRSEETKTFVEEHYKNSLRIVELDPVEDDSSQPAESDGGTAEEADTP